MIRDLRFDELERADRKRRLTRLVVICLIVSSAATFLVSRELKIKKEFTDLPQAQIGDLGSLQERHAAIEEMLGEHHVWVGAYKARAELDDLMVSIAGEERNIAKLEDEKKKTETRIREEAQAARSRALVLAERKEYDLALGQFRKSLELCDSLGRDGWNGGPWEFRDQVVVDIHALENLANESK